MMVAHGSMVSEQIAGLCEPRHPAVVFRFPAQEMIAAGCETLVLEPRSSPSAPRSSPELLECTARRTEFDARIAATEAAGRTLGLQQVVRDFDLTDAADRNTLLLCLVPCVGTRATDPLERIGGHALVGAIAPGRTEVAQLRFSGLSPFCPHQGSNWVVPRRDQGLFRGEATNLSA